MSRRISSTEAMQHLSSSHNHSTVDSTRTFCEEMEDDTTDVDCADVGRSCCRLMPISKLKPPEQTFVSSLRPEKDELPQMIEKMSIGGKSGAPLYFTHDSELIVKSIPDSEFKFLSSWADRYCDHMERNPDSVLVRLYGLYEIQLHETQKVFGFIVMRNVAAISGVTGRCATAIVA